LYFLNYKFTLHLFTLKTLFILLIYSLFFLSNNCFSQELRLKIITKDSLNQHLLQQIKFKHSELDSISILKELDTITIQLNQLGFLNLKRNTINKNNSTHIVNYTLGKQYEKIHTNLTLNNSLLNFITQNNFTITKNYIKINFTEIQSFLKQLTAYYEKRGDSFVKISLKNISLKNGSIISDLYIEKNNNRKIDRIIIEGYKKFPKSHIKQILKINIPFNTSNLQKISRSIKLIPFAEEIKAPQVLFTKDSTLIYLYLKKKKINYFDGLIGFTSNENEKALKFEGYLDLKLNNIFNSGEQLELFWKNNGDQTKKIKLEVETPFILKSSFSPRVSLEIFSQDTTFVNLQSNLSLNYNLNLKTKISGSVTFEKSTKLLKQTSNNNNIKNYSTYFYGLHYQYSVETSNLLFPKKYKLILSTHFGNRKTDNKNESQQKIVLNTEYLYQLSEKYFLFLKNDNRLLISEKYLNNELFRIGGTNSVRGFQEESVYSSAYSSFTIENRYLTNKDSYLYTITDYAYIENKITNNKLNLFGLGLGYAFTTKAGLLNFSYVIGKPNKQSINPNNAVIHIKLITFF